MKRLIALPLAMALCFGLTACKDKTEDKYADLIALLDAGKYDAAIGYIQDLQPEDNSTSTGANTQLGLVIGTDQGNSEQDEAEATAMLPLLMGQWDWTYAPKEGLPKKWVFNEDGTCYADDMQLQWKSEGLFSITPGVKQLKVTVSTSNEVKYTLLLYKRESGELGLSCNTGNAIIIGATERYIKLDQYEIVQLTADNWQTYLETTETTICNYNAFGDIESMGTDYRLVLKNAYFSRLSYYATASCDAEISYTARKYEANVDYEKGTYTVGALANDGGSGETQICTLYKNNDYFGATYACTYLNNLYPATSDSKTTCAIPTNVHTLRVQGTLYLLKTN